MQVYLQSIYVMFAYEGHRVTVKVKLPFWYTGISSRYLYQARYEGHWVKGQVDLRFRAIAIECLELPASFLAYSHIFKTCRSRLHIKVIASKLGSVSRLR